MRKGAFLEFLVHLVLALDQPRVGLRLRDDVHRHLDAHLLGQPTRLLDDFGVVHLLSGTTGRAREQVAPALFQGLHEAAVLGGEVHVDLDV